MIYHIPTPSNFDLKREQILRDREKREEYDWQELPPDEVFRLVEGIDLEDFYS